MPVSVRGTDVLFNDSSTQSTGVPSTLKLIRPRAWAYQYAHGPQTTRNVRYISRYAVVNFTQNPYYGAASFTTVSMGNDQLTWVTGARPVRVIINMGIYSYLDDYATIRLIRDGSIVNSTTHSGGVILFNDENEKFSNSADGYYTGAPGFRLPQRHGDYFVHSITDDIPANTTRTYYYYAGSQNGSGGDGLATSFSIELGQIL